MSLSERIRKALGQTAPTSTHPLPQELQKRIAECEAKNESLRPLVEALGARIVEQDQKSVEILEKLAEFQDEAKALRGPEHYLGVVTGVYQNGSLHAEVAGPGLQRLVLPIHPEVSAETVRPGVRCKLSQDRKCVLEMLPGRPEWRDLGTFEECLPDDRILVRHHEELLALRTASQLETIGLKKGDRIGFDRELTGLAYERIETPPADHLFTAELPAHGFEAVAGQSRIVRLLQELIAFRFQYPGIAIRYQLPTRQGILFDGPPGNGKTLIARAFAGHAGQVHFGGHVRFMAISAGQDLSMWLGQSEANLRARFAAIRDHAQHGLVVLFIDEIDAIGRQRGLDHGSSAAERVLNTLLVELDGLIQLENVIVIAATNRADLLDSALVRDGRFDLKIRIPAPDRATGRAVLNHYLTQNAGLPLDPIGDDARHVIVEGLLSRVYSPNGPYAKVAIVKLSDGRQFPAPGRELLSAAMLKGVVVAAARTAARREAATGQAGISERDLVEALHEKLRAATARLTHLNVRSCIGSLPEDAVPTRVESLLV